MPFGVQLHPLRSLSDSDEVLSWLVHWRGAVFGFEGLVYRVQEP